MKEVYTYVGSGDAPPNVTKFLGIQEFVRGEPTEVTDPLVLKKIEGHPCFVKGAVDRKTLHKNDTEAKERADKVRRIDAVLDKAFKKKHHGE